MKKENGEVREREEGSEETGARAVRDERCEGGAALLAPTAEISLEQRAIPTVRAEERERAMERKGVSEKRGGERE